MPTTTTRKIFYNKPELCTNRWSIFVSARGSPTAVSTSTTAASVAVAVTIAARTAGVLHDHALAAKLLAVQLVNGVVGVAGVLELHEAVPIFEVYFEEATIATEKALDVLLPDVVAKASYVDARHVRGGRRARRLAVERRTARQKPRCVCRESGSPNTHLTPQRRPNPATQ